MKIIKNLIKIIKLGNIGFPFYLEPLYYKNHGGASKRAACTTSNLQRKPPMMIWNSMSNLQEKGEEQRRTWGLSSADLAPSEAKRFIYKCK